MIEKYVKPGKRVDLRAYRRENFRDDKEEKTYASKVYDVKDDTTVEILMPMEGTKLVLLPVGGEFELFFYSEGSLYQCVGKVKSRYKEGNTYMLLITLETNLRRYQRREYYRYACTLDLFTRDLETEEIKSFDKGENILLDGMPLHQCVVVDISGGGIRFAATKRYEKGQKIYCKYELLIKGEYKVFELAGTILEVYEREKHPGEFEHRVQYFGVENEVREEIIQYIFEEERKNRAKERGY